jgi:outer membrane protein assembly factor BamB
MVYSSPAVAAGVAFVGSTDGNLYAVDIVSGAQKWKFEAKSRITSSPALAGGLVYFGAYNGNFYAVNAADGQLKWKFQTAGERRYSGTHLHGSQPAAETMPDPFDFYLSSPTIWKGAVFFGNGDGNVYSLNAASGAMNWKFKTGDVVHASPAISDGALFVGRPAKIQTFTTRSAFSRQPRWPTASFTSVAAIPTSTPSTPKPARKNGRFPITAPG